MIIRTALALSLATTLVPELRADTVSLNPVQDNTMWEEQDFASNGSGSHLFLGQNGLSVTRRALLQFDLSAIPAEASICAVELQIVVNMTVAGPHPCTAHRMLASWGEGASDANGNEGQGGIATTDDATWDHRFWPDVFWTTPGGDFDPAVSGNTSLAGTGSYTVSGPGMVADVQGWLNDPSTNHGWILRGEENIPTTAKRFGSREGSAGARPVLTVTWSLPGDLDGDGMVGVAELLDLLAQWGVCGGNCTADFDCSGDVGVTDLLALLSNWG